MSRDLTTEVGTEVAQSVIRPVVFVELDYPSGFVRVNSTDRILAFETGTESGVEQFLGIGQLGSISSIGENTELQASRISLTLSGVNPVNVSAAFEKAQGRRGRIWFGFLDSSWQIITDPVLMFVGLIDNTEIELGDTGTITVNLNNRFIEWSRDKNRRYTNEDQQAEFPGDRFFEFIPQAVEKEIIWGPGGPEPVNPGSGTGGFRPDPGGSGGSGTVGGGFRPDPGGDGGTINEEAINPQGGPNSGGHDVGSRGGGVDI